MKLYCGKKSERGTSMVEVTVAIAILGIMAGGIIGSFTYGFYVMSLARENQRATQIILEKMEAIRLFSWDQVNTPGFIPTSFTDHYDPQGVEGAQGPTYSGTLALVPFPDTSASYGTNMREIDLTLTWTNSFGRLKRTRSMSTFISKDGIQNYVY